MTGLLARFRVLAESLWDAATRDYGSSEPNAEGERSCQDADDDAARDAWSRDWLRWGWDRLCWGWNFGGGPHAPWEPNDVVLLQAEDHAERGARAGEGASGGRAAQLSRDIVGLACAAARLNPTGARRGPGVSVLQSADDLRQARERRLQLDALALELLRHLLQADAAEGQRGAGEG